MAISKVGYKSSRRSQGFDPIEVPGVSEQLRLNFEMEDKSISRQEQQLADIRQFNREQKRNREAEEAEIRLKTVAQYSKTGQRALVALEEGIKKRRETDAKTAILNQQMTQQELEAAEAEYEAAEKQSDKVLAQQRLAAAKDANVKAVDALGRLDTLQLIQTEQFRLENLQNLKKPWTLSQLQNNNSTIVPLPDGSTTTPMEAYRSRDSRAVSAALSVLDREFLEKYTPGMHIKAVQAMGPFMVQGNSEILASVRNDEDILLGQQRRDEFIKTFSVSGDYSRTIQRIANTPDANGVYLGLPGAKKFLHSHIVKGIQNGVYGAQFATDLLAQQHPVDKKKSIRDADKFFAAQVDAAIQTRDKQERDLYYQNLKESARVRAASILEDYDSNPNSRFRNKEVLEGAIAELKQAGFNPHILAERLGDLSDLTGNGSDTSKDDMLKRYHEGGQLNEGHINLVRATNPGLAAKWDKKLQEDRQNQMNPKDLKSKRKQLEGLLKSATRSDLLWMTDADATDEGQRAYELLNRIMVDNYEENSGELNIHTRTLGAYNAAESAWDTGKNDPTSPFYYDLSTKSYPNLMKPTVREQASSRTGIDEIATRIKKQKITGNRVHTALYGSADSVQTAVDTYTKTGEYDNELLHYWVKYNRNYNSPFELLKKAADHYKIPLDGPAPTSLVDTIIGRTTPQQEIPVSQQVYVGPGTYTAMLAAKGNKTRRAYLDFRSKQPVNHTENLQRLFPNLAPQSMALAEQAGTEITGLDTDFLAYAHLATHEVQKNHSSFSTDHRGVRDTGAGHIILDNDGQPVTDNSGRAVTAASRDMALAMRRMVRDSDGLVRWDQFTSIQRSKVKNAEVGGVPNSNHLEGGTGAFDYNNYHAEALEWLQKNARYYGFGWNDPAVTGYQGHAGHFDWKGTDTPLEVEDVPDVQMRNLVERLKFYAAQGMSQEDAYIAAIKELTDGNERRWIDNLIVYGAPANMILSIVQRLDR